MTVQWRSMLSYMAKMLPYLPYTFLYVFCSLVFGIILGFFCAMAKLGKNRVLKGIAGGYTTFMRCMPSITVLFLVYYMVPALMRNYLNISLDGMNALFFVILTFTLFLGASLSEMMRTSYLAVARDQFEAALSLGLTAFQAFRRIILPQAFFYSLPNLGNTVIYLLKEGALGYTIGLTDVMGKAYLMNADSYSVHALEIYISLALIYWPVALLLEQIFKKLEEKFSCQETASRGFSHAS
ncbi:MAG: amino acid ABC transporter permease [Spirochaetaceae bacterium]|nr:amino acid ABC transporter permease [Spirochaetaceae bacterium]